PACSASELTWTVGKTSGAGASSARARLAMPRASTSGVRREGKCRKRGVELGADMGKLHDYEYANANDSHSIHKQGDCQSRSGSVQQGERSKGQGERSARELVPGRDSAGDGGAYCDIHSRNSRRSSGEACCQLAFRDSRISVFTALSLPVGCS